MQSKWLVVTVAGVAALGIGAYLASRGSFGSARPAGLAAGTGEDGTAREVALEEPPGPAPTGDEAPDGRHERIEAAQAEPCAFFEPWAHRGRARATVAGLLEEIRPLRAEHVECVPTAWWLTALVLECEGTLHLTSPEHDLVAGAITAGLGDLRNAPRDAFADLVDFEDLVDVGDPDSPGFRESVELLQCLVHGMVGPDAPPGALAEAWAWWLVTAYGGLETGSRGGMFGPDERVAAALRVVMADWPLHDDTWWESLWGGFPDEPPADQPSVAVRVAVFDALHGLVSEEVWLDRLGRLAEFEDWYEGFISFQTLWGMGAVMSSHLGDQRVAELLTRSGGDDWQRALLFHFPENLKWPASDGGPPEHVRRALRDLRDSPHFTYRLDVLQHQWRLLGPPEAAADLERFVLETHPSLEGWDFEAALRINAALEALQLAGEEPSGPHAAAFEHARGLILQFVLESPPADVERALVALRDRLWVTGGKDELRALLHDVLDPTGLAALPQSLRDWLAAK